MGGGGTKLVWFILFLLASYHLSVMPYHNIRPQIFFHIDRVNNMIENLYKSLVSGIYASAFLHEWLYDKTLSLILAQFTNVYL